MAIRTTFSFSSEADRQRGDPVGGRDRRRYGVPGLPVRGVISVQK